MERPDGSVDNWQETGRGGRHISRERASRHHRQAHHSRSSHRRHRSRGQYPQEHHHPRRLYDLEEERGAESPISEFSPQRSAYGEDERVGRSIHRGRRSAGSARGITDRLRNILGFHNQDEVRSRHHHRAREVSGRGRPYRELPLSEFDRQTRAWSQADPPSGLETRPATSTESVSRASIATEVPRSHDNISHRSASSHPQFRTRTFEPDFNRGPRGTAPYRGDSSHPHAQTRIVVPDFVQPSQSVHTQHNFFDGDDDEDDDEDDYEDDDDDDDGDDDGGQYDAPYRSGSSHPHARTRIVEPGPRFFGEAARGRSATRSFAREARPEISSSQGVSGPTYNTRIVQPDAVAGSSHRGYSRGRDSFPRGHSMARQPGGREGDQGQSSRQKRGKGSHGRWNVVVRA